LGSAQKELTQIRAEIRRNEVELAGLNAKEKALAQATVPDPFIDEALDKDPVVRGLTDRQMELTVSLAGQTAEKSQEMGKQLQAVKEALAEQRQERRPQVAQQVRQKILHEAKAARTDLEARLSLRFELAKRLEEDVKTFSAMTQ